MDTELRDRWREQPHPRRLAAHHPQREEILLRHQEAIQSGAPVYADPVSGFSVFTADFLAARRSCCDSGCRHCPYLSSQ